jgi:hypothetical protein
VPHEEVHVVVRNLCLLAGMKAESNPQSASQNCKKASSLGVLAELHL